MVVKKSYQITSLSSTCLPTLHTNYVFCYTALYQGMSRKHKGNNYWKQINLSVLEKHPLFKYTVQMSEAYIIFSSLFYRCSFSFYL